MSTVPNDANDAQKPVQRAQRPLWHYPVRAALLVGAIVGGMAVAIVGYNVSDGSPLGFALALLAVIGYSLVLAAIDWLVFD